MQHLNLITNSLHETTEKFKKQQQKQQKRLKMTLQQYLESTNLKRRIASRSKSKQNRKNPTTNQPITANTLQLPQATIQYFKLTQEWKSKKVFNSWISRLKQLCRQYIIKDQQYIQKLTEFVKTQIQTIKKDNLLLESYLVTQASYWPDGGSAYNQDNQDPSTHNYNPTQQHNLDKTQRLSNYLKSLLKKNQLFASPCKSQIINGQQTVKKQADDKNNRENIVYVENKIASQPKVKIVNNEQCDYETVDRNKNHINGGTNKGLNHYISSTGVKENSKNGSTSCFYRNQRVQQQQQYNNSLDRHKLSYHAQNGHKNQHKINTLLPQQNSLNSKPTSKQPSTNSTKNHKSNPHEKQPHIDQRQKHLIYSFKDPYSGARQPYQSKQNSIIIEPFDEQQSHLQYQNSYLENNKNDNSCYLQLNKKVSKQSNNQDNSLLFERSVDQVPRLSLMSRYDQNRNNSKDTKGSSLISNNRRNGETRMSQISTKQEIYGGNINNNTTNHTSKNTSNNTTVILKCQNQQNGTKSTNYEGMFDNRPLRDRKQKRYALQSNSYQNSQNMILMCDNHKLLDQNHNHEQQNYFIQSFGNQKDKPNNKTKAKHQIQPPRLQKANQQFDFSIEKSEIHRRSSIQYQKRSQIQKQKQKTRQQYSYVKQRKSSKSQMSQYSPNNIVLLETPSTLKVNKNHDEKCNQTKNGQLGKNKDGSDIIVRTNMIEPRENITKRYENYRKASLK